MLVVFKWSHSPGLTGKMSWQRQAELTSMFYEHNYSRTFPVMICEGWALAAPVMFATQCVTRSATRQSIIHTFAGRAALPAAWFGRAACLLPGSAGLTAASVGRVGCCLGRRSHLPYAWVGRAACLLSGSAERTALPIVPHSRQSDNMTSHIHTTITHTHHKTCTYYYQWAERSIKIFQKLFKTTTEINQKFHLWTYLLQYIGLWYTVHQSKDIFKKSIISQLKLPGLTVNAESPHWNKTSNTSYSGLNLQRTPEINLKISLYVRYIVTNFTCLCTPNVLQIET